MSYRNTSPVNPKISVLITHPQLEVVAIHRVRSGISAVIMRSDLLEYCCHHHNVIWSILGYLLSLYCYILNGASYRRRAIRSIQRCLLCAQSWVVIVISSGQSQDVFSVYTLKVELSSSLMITMVLMLLGVWHVLAAQPPQLLAQVMTPGVNQWHSGFDGVQSLPSTITGLLFTRLVAGSRYAAHASTTTSNC
jgi:hypothetical protein